MKTRPKKAVPPYSSSEEDSDEDNSDYDNDAEDIDYNEDDEETEETEGIAEDEDDDDYDEEYEEEEEYEDEEDETHCKTGFYIAKGPNPNCITLIITGSKRLRQEDDDGDDGDERDGDMYAIKSTHDIESSFSPEEKQYWESLKKTDKSTLIKRHKDMSVSLKISNIPLKFKILNLNIMNIPRIH